MDKDTIFRRETTFLNIETIDDFNWIDFSSTDTIVKISPTEAECYIVEVYNIHACSVTDSVCIVVLDVFCNEDGITVPTAFSPNEDGVNDTYL